MNKKHIGFDVPWPNLRQAWAFTRKWLLPNPGTLVLIVVLALALPALAAPQLALESASTQTVSYQGRLADSAGNPLTGYYNLEFRIYDVPDGGVPLWEELWTGGNSVQVSDGLFNVMLGSLNSTLASAIEGQDELYLGITVGTDTEMVPRVQLGSVPFSMQAMTVPDGSITTEKLADGAVTPEKLSGYGAGLIQSWNGTNTAFAADGPSQPRVTFDTGIDVEVPEGTTQYYLVTYAGDLGYWGWARIDPDWFNSSWGAWLVDGATVLARSELPGVGHRMKWDNFQNSWTATFWTTWMVELESGAHSLDVTISGYSDGTMSEAFVHNQKLRAVPLR